MLKTIKKLADGEHAFIVCIGDSITEQNYHLHEKLNYVGRLTERLMELYGRKSLVLNAGMSGHTTVDLLGRLERDALRFKPDLVLVMIGMNDSAQGKVPLEQFHDNLQQIVSRIRAAGSELLLLTQNGLDFNVIEEAVVLRRAYPDYVEVIRKVAGEEDVPICDICRQWEEYVQGSTNNHLMLMDDSIHPGDQGHAWMAKALHAYLGIDPI